MIPWYFLFVVFVHEWWRCWEKKMSLATRRCDHTARCNFEIINSEGSFICLRWSSVTISRRFSMSNKKRNHRYLGDHLFSILIIFTTKTFAFKKFWIFCVFFFLMISWWDMVLLDIIQKVWSEVEVKFSARSRNPRSPRGDAWYSVHKAFIKENEPQATAWNHKNDRDYPDS